MSKTVDLVKKAPSILEAISLAVVVGNAAEPEGDFKYIVYVDPTDYCDAMDGESPLTRVQSFMNYSPVTAETVTIAHDVPLTNRDPREVFWHATIVREAAPQ